MRQLRQPRLQTLSCRDLERFESRRERRVPLAQLRAELQKPCESVRTLEGRPSFSAQILHFIGDLLGRDALLERLARFRREWRVGERARQSCEQPVTMNR